MSPSILLIGIAAVALVLALLVRARSRKRQRVLGELLDAADALEARLRLARAEIAAVAGDEQDPVRDALREMLRQRLWLREHGGAANLTELADVRSSIDAARVRIDQQLVLIERARAPLV